MRRLAPPGPTLIPGKARFGGPSPFSGASVPLARLELPLLDPQVACELGLHRATGLLSRGQGDRACGTTGFVVCRAGYSHIAMTEPTPTVLPDPPLEPRRPGEPPTVDIPEPPDPAEPWNEPERPEPPTPHRPPELPPDDDL